MTTSILNNISKYIYMAKDKVRVVITKVKTNNSKFDSTVSTPVEQIVDNGQLVNDPQAVNPGVVNFQK